jgi:hemin uptake protein HemP
MKPENRDTRTTPGYAPGESPGGNVAPVVSSQELLGRRRHLQIDHGGERYVLRVTRQGKLILTK